MPTIFNSNVSTSTVQIFLRTLRNKNISIHVESTATVYELKDFIERKYGIPLETQQLFYQGRLLKDKRSLSTYKVNTGTTMNQPILLTQSFKVDVFTSTKVLSLYSLTVKKKAHIKELPSQQTIQCCSTTTINSLLKQLNLFHLSHLLKVCVGAATQDIKDMDQKVIDIPHLLSDGILSILFSARWFLDRTVDIATFNSLMSQTIQKSINSAKLLKSCASFRKLDYQFSKTQSFIFSQFDEIETILNALSYDVNKANKWCQNLAQNNYQKKLDNHSDKLLNQLQNKIGQIHDTVKLEEKKWNKKRQQIVTYLQETVRRIEIGLMSSFKTWITNDIIEWLQYMDNGIILSDFTIKQFKGANINGYHLENINDLSLKLMGVKDSNIRQLIVGYVNALLLQYDDNMSIHSDHDIDDTHNNNNNNNDNICCICVRNEVNTVIVPCGHAIYCEDCSKKSVKHDNRCPICRQSANSIINIYKAGFNLVTD